MIFNRIERLPFPFQCATVSVNHRIGNLIIRFSLFANSNNTQCIHRLLKILHALHF